MGKKYKMPVIEKKPIDIVIEYNAQLKIMLELQRKTIEDLKNEVKGLRASVSVLTDNIREQNDIQKKGWIW